MAYFDSPKNRAMWELELEDLKKLKADFASGKLTEAQAVPVKKDNATESRKPISFDQLMKEDKVLSAPKSMGKGIQTEKKKERQAGL